MDARRVKQQAYQLGFDACGIAAAGPASSHPHYLAWLEHGYQAGMGYMARPDTISRRADLRALLPPAHSVIVVGLNCYTPEDPDQPNLGRVARYAWGADYHHAISTRLEQLAGWLQQEAGRRLAYKVCVDTSALLEREWAVRAGLGWIGKNTMLISPHFGSWLLLGELLVELELEPDTPFAAERCGACQHCIQACPTGCILPDRQVDARRCISYLTIEQRQEIPADLQPAIGAWLFGCDVCQQVCPWNRFAQPARSFDARPGWTQLDPAYVLAMDETAFRAYFAGSPIMRARLAGLARNAAIVLHNQSAGQLKQAC